MPKTKAERASTRVRAASRSRARDVLASEWCAWIAENAVRGVSVSDLVATLVAGGVPKALARRAVTEIRSSPALHGVVSAMRRARRAELLVRLQRAVAGGEGGEGKSAFAVERRTKPSADEFFDRYFARNRPVVLTDATRRWKLWTPGDMKELLGAMRIEVTSDRESDPDYDMRHREHARRTTMAAFVDRVLAAGETNDFYLVANNKAMERRGMEKLLARIVIDETWFDPARVRNGGASIWLGPKGTVTPLHHDTTNILFHQIHGRKRFLLVPPDAAPAHEGARGFYALDDPEALIPERRRAWKGVPVTSVVLEPGEALFLPVGWWHHVRSLDVSISLSLMCFRRLNSFDWYRPGFADPG